MKMLLFRETDPIGRLAMLRVKASVLPWRNEKDPFLYGYAKGSLFW